MVEAVQTAEKSASRRDVRYTNTTQTGSDKTPSRRLQPALVQWCVDVNSGVSGTGCGSEANLHVIRIQPSNATGNVICSTAQRACAKINCLSYLFYIIIDCFRLHLAPDPGDACFLGKDAARVPLGADAEQRSMRSHRGGRKGAVSASGRALADSMFTQRSAAHAGDTLDRERLKRSVTHSPCSAPSCGLSSH
jgi:hypothetical protein